MGIQFSLSVSLFLSFSLILYMCVWAFLVHFVKKAKEANRKGAISNLLLHPCYSWLIHLSGWIADKCLVQIQCIHPLKNASFVYQRVSQTSLPSNQMGRLSLHLISWPHHCCSPEVNTFLLPTQPNW